MATFTRLDYLRDLLFFAQLHVDFDTTTDPASVDQVAALLAGAFLQPFDKVIDGEHETQSLRPVHQARLGVEVLRRYLAELDVDTTDADRRYRLTAYQTLLVNLGTSFEELRLVRAASDDEVARARQALADRLGFDRLERLDALLIRPDLLTEDVLDALFGLAPTTGDPFDASRPRPAILQWHADRLRQQWKGEPVAGVVIDPDLIGDDMVRDPDDDDGDASDEIASEVITPQARAAAVSLRRARAEEVEQVVADVQDEIDEAIDDQPTTLDAFDAVIADVLGPVDLEAILEERTEGADATDAPEDEPPPLAELSLTALRRLVRLRKLAASGTLTDEEWTDIREILVLVVKTRRFPEWRDEEIAAGVFVSPDFFTLPESRRVRAGAPWRTTIEARVAFAHTLQARTQQLQTLVRALQDTVSAAEDVALPQCRDAFIAAVAARVAERDPGVMADRLTTRLQIDFKSTDPARTTRMQQAIETVQGLLFALRMGRALGQDLPDDGSVEAWRVEFDNRFTETDFDAEWQWRGTFAMREAAEQVKDHPEGFLFPGLRDDGVAPQQRPTEAFTTLLARLRDQARLTRGRARELAAQFLATWPAEITTEISTRLAEIANAAPEPFVLTEQLTEADLVLRRTLLEHLFDDDALDTTYTTDEGEVIEIRDPHLAPDWQQEIFFFAPLAIAQQLQRSGEFLAALDWYQTVYMYAFPPEGRPIYRGLAMEGVFSDRPRISPDVWLREELNPHFFGRQRKHAYTRFTVLSIVQCLLEYADSEFTRETTESLTRARALYLTALDLAQSPEMPALNPVAAAVRQQAAMNLAKLRAGRNIAGLERPPDRRSDADPASISAADGRLVVNSGVTFKPTPYRYTVLIARAKELAAIATQMEEAYLSTLEKRDHEAYTLLQAGHDIELSKVMLTLQDLRLGEAETGVALATLQKERAEIQSTTFQEFIDAGLNGWEDAMLKRYAEARDARMDAARVQMMGQSIGGWLGGDFFGTLGNLHGLEGTLTALRAEADASMASVKATHERRRQEWLFQKALADKDIEIADQQIGLATTQRDIVQQEGEIANLHLAHAERTMNFLVTKFTNTELYEWMSAVLGRVYSYFLQQATALAQLAQHQLAFERQEATPSIIKADYWEPFGDTDAAPNGEEPRDRKGLTGSARLTADIHRLDLYAFETETRKLQLSQTLSLAQLFPFEFERFRETGVLTFATPLELFDREFPGHYLRLIKRVSASFVALLSPTQGVRATLTASGVSRVVTRNGVFRTTIVRGDPELVAFTSARNATGLFDGAPEGEMLLPFEGRGVDTLWALELPKAANAFDRRTLADVLFTIQYTALHSSEYRQQVIQRLDRSVSSERSFSFRQEYADAFYDLNNPAASETPMVVRFRTRRDDFPPNLESLHIEHVLLFFARADGASFEVPVDHLRFVEAGAPDDADPVGGEATSIDGVISTRRGNGTAWTPFIGRQPVGSWELALPNTPEIVERFRMRAIEDVLFVIAYGATTVPWPASALV